MFWGLRAGESSGSQHGRRKAPPQGGAFGSHTAVSTRQSGSAPIPAGPATQGGPGLGMGGVEGQMVGVTNRTSRVEEVRAGARMHRSSDETARISGLDTARADGAIQTNACCGACAHVCVRLAGWAGKLSDGHRTWKWFLFWQLAPPTPGFRCRSARCPDMSSTTRHRTTACHTASNLTSTA